MAKSLRTRSVIAGIFLGITFTASTFSGQKESSDRGRRFSVGNNLISRTFEVDGGQASTRTVTSAQGIEVLSKEFEIVCRTDRYTHVLNRYNTTLKGLPAAISKDHASITWTAESPAIEIRAEYQADRQGPYLFKWLEVTNRGGPPVMIEQVTVDELELKGTPEPMRGGVGQPVLLNNQLFFGVEHPAGQNEVLANSVRLSHHPYVELQSGATWKSQRVVLGSVAGERQSVEEAFRNYLMARSGRAPRLRTIYNDWAAHDELGTLVKPQLTEKLADSMLDTLQELKLRYGVQFDYYLMDAFWYDPIGSFITFKVPNWPNGCEPFLKRIRALGMKPGLWFDLGASTLDLKGTAGWSSPEKPCLSDSSYARLLGNAFEYHIRNHSLSLLKFDFANLLCSHEKDTCPSIAIVERNVNALRELCDQARRLQPDLMVRAYNLFSIAEMMSSTKYYDESYAISPWWLLWFDSIYSGDPRASELPSFTSLRDSVNWYQDHVYRGYARSLMPLFTIDDCGSMVGKTSTILYLGAEGFTDSWVLSVMRGNLAPIFHGDITLLDENARRFLAGTMSFLKEHQEVIANTRPILGIPGAGQVYGYFSEHEDLAFVTLVNPGLLPQSTAFEIPEARQSGETMRLLFTNDGDAGKSTLPWDGSLQCSLVPGEIRVYALGPRTKIESLSFPAAPTRKYHQIVPIQDPFGGGKEASIRIESGNVGMTLALVVRYRRGGKPDRSFDRPQEVLRVSGKIGKKTMDFSSIPREGTDMWSRGSWAVFKHLVTSAEDNSVARLALEGNPPTGTTWSVTAFWIK